MCLDSLPGNNGHYKLFDKGVAINLGMVAAITDIHTNATNLGGGIVVWSWDAWCVELLDLGRAPYVCMVLNILA